MAPVTLESLCVLLDWLYNIGHEASILWRLAVRPFLWLAFPCRLSTALVVDDHQGNAYQDRTAIGCLCPHGDTKAAKRIAPPIATPCGALSRGTNAYGTHYPPDSGDRRG